MPTLLELVRSLDELEDEDVIFVKPEWTPQAESKVFQLAEGGRVPAEATEAGFKYFLEAPIAREVLESMEAASPEQKCDRLIYYATYDA